MTSPAYMVTIRLLNTRTKIFVFVQDPRTVHYAILSHVWSKLGSPGYTPEQTYQDLCQIIANKEKTLAPSSPSDPSQGHVSGSVKSNPPSTEGGSAPLQLSDKIRWFCEVALADGFELACTDTCCIDKENPSELAEAITCMYYWFSYAKACYVFLPDVSDPDRNARPGAAWEMEFRESLWFLRGWTLQELLAPNVVIFFSKNWEVLGSKHELAPLVDEITSIERAINRCEKPLDEVSVACRMSWAASRETTREEDRAYSMLGIFGVNIRIVYGEGSYAFYRLQEAIINEIPDQTIFAWKLCTLPPKSLLKATFSRPSDEHPPAYVTADKQLPDLPATAIYHPQQYLLANSPGDFAGCSDLIPLSQRELVQTLGVAPADTIQIFKSTSYGISARLPLVEFTPSSGPSDSATYLALLACRFGRSGSLVALLLRQQDNDQGVHASRYVVGTTLEPHSEAPPTPSDLRSSPRSKYHPFVRATVLTPDQLEKCRRTFIPVEVLVANRPSRAQHKLERDVPLYGDLAITNEAFEVQLCGWSSRLLEQQGYTASPRNGPYSAITLDVEIRLEDVATLIVITRGSHVSSPRLEIQVGRLCIKNDQALGVAVRSSPNMQLVDGVSGRTGIYHSHISSWNWHGGAAMKELGLIFFHGEQLTLRLVLTHSPSDPSHGITGKTTVYRVGAEIFGTQNHFAPSPSFHLPQGMVLPNGPTRHLPAGSNARRGSSHAPTSHPAPPLAHDAHRAHQATAESSSTERLRRKMTSPRR